MDHSLNKDTDCEKYVWVDKADVEGKAYVAHDGEVIQRLDHHQKNVDIAKVVGNTECAVGSILGIVGAGLLFSPLAPVGVVVGLVGVGLGVKGAAVEGGATITNYVMGKHAVKDFDEDVRDASIDREALCKIWGNICNCAKQKQDISVKEKEELAIEFIEEVKKWDIPLYYERKRKYVRRSAPIDEDSDQIKWYELWRSEEKEKRMKERLADILDFIVNFWLEQLIGYANLQIMRQAHKKFPDSLGYEDLSVMGSTISKAGTIANSTVNVTKTTLRIAPGGIGVLDEIAQESIELASKALCTLDDVGNATTNAMKTARTVMASPIFGIVTGSVGFIMSSISLGMNIKSLNNGSKSEKERTLLVFMQQIDLSCEMMQNIAEVLVNR